MSIGIIQLIRISNSNSLHILEQARLVDQLKTEAKMTLSEIASRVDRSPSWVSVRLGLLNETSAFTLNEIFNGRLPARASLYTLRTFTRVKKIPAVEIDKFVKAVSGKSLSTRNIDVLAKGYFQGGKQIRVRLKTVTSLKPSLNSRKSTPIMTQRHQNSLSKKEPSLKI